MTFRSSATIPERLKEALSCFMLGLRDARHPQSLLSTLCLWVFAWVAVGVVFYAFLERLFALALEATATLIMVGSALIPDHGGGGLAGGGIAAAGTATVWGLGVAGVLVASTYVLLSLLTVRLLAEIFVMGWIRKRALSRYPALRERKAAPAARSPFLKEWAGTWGLLLISPACLLLPVAGSLLLLVLLCYLNARFLVNDALEDIPTDATPAQMSQELRLELLAIGLISVLACAIPFLGLLAPWATGAAVCHLNFRRLSTTANPLPAQMQAA
ncbi:EI24 domain-containing protein [Niveibacterium sp. SC-1]|uniref:EI24 domain-containing protein n=1 Tax=Niveibacterium sp. SC-1 TaxID=3135646 RepID=UPI00311F78CB